MDEKQLEEWLDDKPREVSSAIASRAALRVAPILTREFVENQDQLNELQIQVLRCYLISSLLAKMWSDDIESAADFAARSALSAAYSADFALSAAYSADSAADFAARSAALSADFALSAALSALSAEFEIWPEVEWDMRFIEENGVESAGALVEQELFHVEGNDWSAGDYEAVRELGQVDGYAWWSNWLMQMHDGTFRDWDLAEKIALIEDKYWKKGAIAVAEKISKFTRNEREPSENSNRDLDERAAFMLKSMPTATVLHAEDLKKSVNLFIEHYDTCESNERPQIFVILESFIGVATKIEKSVQSEDVEALKARIKELEALVKSLNEELASAKAPPSSWKVFKDTFAEESAKTIHWVIRGGIVSGVTYFVDQSSPQLVEELIKLFPKP